MGVRKLSELQVVPQRRDKILFERLADFGFLSSNQIANHIFHVRRRVAAVRLWRLSTAGFIDIIPENSSSTPSIYTPNLLALRNYLSPHYLERARKSKASYVWRRVNLEHEETSREVALRILSAFPEVQVDLDHLLSPSDWEGDYRESNGTGKVPDFILKIGGRPVGVFEVELTQKSRLRYFRIFNRLIRNARSPIIYLCGSTGIANAVRENYSKVGLFLSKKGSSSTPPLIVKGLEEIATDDGLKRLVDEILESKC